MANLDFNWNESGSSQEYDYIFIGFRRLRISDIGRIIDDFLEDKEFNGRIFSDFEIDELKKMRSADYFKEGILYKEIIPYMLPFFKKEDLKSRRRLGCYEQKKDNF